MQSFICTLYGRVISQQSGLTRHRHSTHKQLDQKSSNRSTSDRLDCALADNIPQFVNNTHNQPPEMEIFPHAGAPIDDTLQVNSFEDDDCDPLAPFVTAHSWQLCYSIVDTNLGKSKPNNIVKPILIIPDANAKNPHQLYQLIVDMEEIVRLECWGEEMSVNIEWHATPFWYQNRNAAVRYLLRHPMFEDHSLYIPVKPTDSSGERIHTEMWTADWGWKTQASCHELWERLFLVRFSLCLGELECHREHVREIKSEGSCQGDHGRESMSERSCQTDRVWQIVTVRRFHRAC